MSRSIELYLDDILSSTDKIERYTATMSKETFVADERTFDAVAHNLQIIGEAIKTFQPRSAACIPKLNGVRLRD